MRPMVVFGSLGVLTTSIHQVPSSLLVPRTHLLSYTLSKLAVIRKAVQWMGFTNPTPDNALWAKFSKLQITVLWLQQSWDVDYVLKRARVLQAQWRWLYILIYRNGKQVVLTYLTKRLDIISATSHPQTGPNKNESHGHPKPKKY